MFHLNSVQNYSYFMHLNYSGQLDHESKYITDERNDEEFNIPSKIQEISYLPLNPYLKEIVPDDGADKWFDINLKENLNLLSNSASFKQYDTSYIFTSLTTSNCNPFISLEDYNKINTKYCCGYSFEQNLHNYLTNWPKTNSLSLDRTSRFENYVTWPELRRRCFHYAPYAFEVSNPYTKWQVLPNINPEYVSSCAVCEYRGNFGKGGWNTTPCNNFGEFNYSQPMQSDSHTAEFEENKFEISNEIGVCLRNLNDIYMNRATERSPICTNSYFGDVNQEPCIEVVDDSGNNDVLLGPEQPPIVETNEEPLDSSINLIQTPKSGMYNASNFRKYEILEKHSNNHTIPEGDDFVQMFQQVSTFEMRFLENKSIFARNPTPDLKGIGFDVAMLVDAHQRFETEHDVNEARKTENEILSMYPLHNRNYQQRY